MADGVDNQRVRALIEQGAQLVEVLPVEEFAEEHLPGARKGRRDPRANAISARSTLAL